MTHRLFSLGICFLVLFHGCLAQLEPRRQQQQQPARLRGRSYCQIERITAREPDRYVKSEAGLSEYWTSDQNQELECAGVEVVRHTIYPKGLLLPYYASSPSLVYVVQGEGIQGRVFSGCPETFETSISSEGGGEEFFDRHQQVYRYQEGDILALPAGAVLWTHNDGDKPIITIGLHDTSNVANQLDRNFRKFFLAGNPLGQQMREGPAQGRGGKGRNEREEHGGGSGGWSGRKGEQGQDQGSNIFSGFTDEILQEVFNVDFNVVKQLKSNPNDNRGLIVHADNFQVLAPQKQEQGRQRSSSRGGGRDNGIEQTICSAELRASIANPINADVYNPRGGRVSNLNSHKLPILEFLQLSAERGVLYKNAVLAPHYNLNAHSIIYVTSGNSRMQIVRNDGSTVFDDVVQEGQLIVVPQDFAVIKKAGEQGCEWVAFKTNDNAKTSQLAGRFSFMQALPEEVIQNSYDVSRQQAQSLKYNRQEGVVFSPSRSERQKLKNALLNGLFG